MKLIIPLLTILCFTTAFAGDVAVSTGYTGKDCKASDQLLFQQYWLGCKSAPDGHDSRLREIVGTKITTTTYDSTNCSGTISSTIPPTHVTIGECNNVNINSNKVTIMTDAEWMGQVVGAGNMVSADYEGSDTCEGDISSAVVVTANNACFRGLNRSRLYAWTPLQLTIMEYGTDDCTGTDAREVPRKLPECTNTTFKGNKRSTKLYANPAATTVTATTDADADATIVIVAVLVVVVLLILGAGIFYQYRVKPSRNRSQKDTQLAKV